jgi:hypothetical protein
VNCQSDSLRAINTGIPQGSSVPPILFLIYLRPLFDVINKHHPNIGCSSYIDDIGLILSGKSQNGNAEHLNQVAKTVFKWADNNGITFDGPKTELVRFDKSRNPNPENNFVTLPISKIIHPTTSVRLLGIWLDNKLSVGGRVEIKTTAATRAYYALKSHAASQNGMSLERLRRIYAATIILAIDYGPEIWWQGQKTMIKSFETLQNKAIRSILGVFKTTFIAALEA